MNQEPKFYVLARVIGQATLIPMMFLAGPIVGFVIGSWVDQKWGTDPWGKTGLSVLGFIASIKQVSDLIKRIINSQK